MRTIAFYLSVLATLVVTACHAAPGARNSAATGDAQLHADPSPYQLVAGDTARQETCARYTLGEHGEHVCQADYPLDTLVMTGFGRYTAVPRSVVACVPTPATIDTIAYGQFSGPDEETGDVSGSELVFQRVADSIRGYLLEAEGWYGRPQALQDLKLEGDTISAWTTTGGRSKLEWRLFLGCDSIGGSFRFVTAAWAADPESISRVITFALPRLETPVQPR